MGGDIKPIGLLLNITDECVLIRIGVEGSCFVTGELTRSGGKAALGAMVCGGDKVSADQRRLDSSSLILAVLTTSLISKIDRERAGLLMLTVCG